MESQTKHNNLLLEWDWELFQDIRTPTYLSFSDIPISELSELDHCADKSYDKDMFEFPSFTIPDNFPLQQHQQDKVNIITTNTKKRRPISVSREPSSKFPARGKVLRRYETLRNKDVMIGFGRNIEPARMEMRDIKERQKRMAAGVEKDEAVVGKGDRSLVVVDGRGGDGAGKGHWSLLRTLKFRSHLSTVLNKASLGLACFSIPPVTNGA